MSQSSFTLNSTLQSNRRFQDRRHIQEADVRHTPGDWKRRFILPILLIPLVVAVSQWHYIVYAPLWLARAHWADRSDLYLGSTNGISNRDLVLQARTYLTDIDHIDAAGNLMAPQALRPLGVHLDPVWFKQHHPGQVDFNPFSSPQGTYVVSWIYYPGCQKTLGKSPRTDTDWYDLRGQPCFGMCRISVMMNRDLRLSSIKVDALQPV